MKQELGEHSTDEVLEQYSMGKLPESECESLEEHLLVCAECQDRLEQTDRFISATRAAARKLQAQPPRSRIALGLYAAAFAALIMAGVLISRPWRTWNPQSGPPVAVVLSAARGSNGPVTGAPAGRPLVLTIETAELPPQETYRLEIVDGHGQRLWEATAAPERGTIHAPVSAKLSPGGHWVRLYSSDNGLLREFSLPVK